MRRMVSLLVLAGLVGCGTVPRLETNYGDIPAGAHQLGQVVQVVALDGTGGDAGFNKAMGESLGRAGLPAGAYEEYRVALLQIYCCGGAMADLMPLVLVPPDLTVRRGNVVEFRAADAGKKGSLEFVNVGIRVRHEALVENGPCWWDPPHEGKWMRVLRADWMAAEGWEHQGGLYPAYYRPSDS